MKLKRLVGTFRRIAAQQKTSSAENIIIQRELTRIDGELGAIRAELVSIKSKSPSSVGRLAAEISCAAEAALRQEGNFAPEPPVRGRAGGLARARHAWRCSDGTFMSNCEREAAIEECEHAE